MSESFRVLFVCTGNVCRSPMAQAMLVAALRERRGDNTAAIEVASAGTGALAGEPMEPFAIDALSGLGIAPGAFTARDITADMLAAADLVLTATRQHRSLVVTIEPRVVRRAFTIKEFARLAASLDDGAALPDLNASVADRLRALVTRVGGQRGVAPAKPAGEDDVADPYGESAQ